jgi:hypothetical protein
MGEAFSKTSGQSFFAFAESLAVIFQAGDQRVLESWNLLGGHEGALTG